MKTQKNNIFVLSPLDRCRQRLFRVLRESKWHPSQSAYYLSISHSRKFIWFRVAKVGTRTIFAQFRRNDIQLDVVHAMNVYYPLRTYNDYFKFAFVRNPFDRLVSCWINKVISRNYFGFDNASRKEMSSFKNFVKFVSKQDLETCDRHLRLQCKLIDLNNLDYLGRQENFEADLDHIFGRINATRVPDIIKNKSKEREGYQSYYDRDTVELVRRIYDLDFRIFNYEFGK